MWMLKYADTTLGTNKFHVLVTADYVTALQIISLLEQAGNNLIHLYHDDGSEWNYRRNEPYNK